MTKVCADHKSDWYVIMLLTFIDTLVEVLNGDKAAKAVLTQVQMMFPLFLALHILQVARTEQTGE